MMERKQRLNRSRAALLPLLCWFSSSSTTTIEATTPLVQHRVKRAQRQVPYQHVLDQVPRTSHDPVHRSASTEGYVHQKLLTQDKEKRYWVYSSSLINSSPSNERQEQQSEGGYMRRLFDAFVGDAYRVENNSNNSQPDANVTAEVEINGTVFNETGESTVYTTTDGEFPTNFHPLRIRAVLTEESDFLTEPERESLFHEMLAPALLSWSSALRVDPVVGNLTVDPQQLSDGNICGPGQGLPSIVVPQEHLTVGIAETDFIVYLNLAFTGPRKKNKTAHDDVSGTNDDDGTLRRRQIRIGESAADSEASQQEQDVIETNSTYLCQGDYLSAASFCSTDQYDRPTAALLHICVDDNFFLPEQRNRNILTLMHELGHAIGFNSLSMAHFRNHDGTPITPRNAEGEIPDTRIECSGPGDNRTFANVALPSEDILQFREVRGGIRVAELVTPFVLQVVRNQFDCQEMTGAELESGEQLPLEMLTEGHGCIGDHWERRLFTTDLMNPIVDEANFSPRISTLTLAYFADSGWYQVDLNYAMVAAGWGRGSGCGFVNSTCIGANGQVPPGNAPFFCNDVPLKHANKQDIRGCTPDLSRKAVCSMAQHDHDLPKEFQYFGSTFGPAMGGDDPFMDYCPVYEGFANGLCSNSENARILQANEIETFGMRNSRCLVGDVGDDREMALCLPIACVVEDQTLRVRVDYRWHKCEEADQVIQSGRTSIICPDPRRICPTFYCPYDCLGTGGVCDFASGKCLCDYPLRMYTVEEEEWIEKETFFWAECGSVNVTQSGDGPESDLSVHIIRPGEMDGKTQILPHPDSPLSDYYVQDSRSLEGRRKQPVWVLVLSLAATCAVLVMLGRLARERRRSGFLANEVDRMTVINRNKDKMVATVLVDLRVRGGHQELDDNLSETDGRLTESVASDMRSDTMSEFSMSRCSEVLSETGCSDDAPTTDENEGNVLSESYVFRRRRLAEDS